MHFFFLSRAVYVPLRRGVSFSGFSLPLLTIGCVVFRHAARLHVVSNDVHPSSLWSPSWPFTFNFHLLHDLPNIVIRPSFDVAKPAEAVFLRFLNDWRHVESLSAVANTFFKKRDEHLITFKSAAEMLDSFGMEQGGSAPGAPAHIRKGMSSFSFSSGAEFEHFNVKAQPNGVYGRTVQAFSHVDCRTTRGKRGREIGLETDGAWQE